MKKCSFCSEVKPLSEYYKHPTGADGFTATCKVCKREMSSRFRERVSPETIKSYTDRYQEKFPNKRKAHVIVGNAIRDKRLLRECCEKCGTDNNIHAHHDDYSKPFNVRWLCALHHKEWHSKYGEALNA